MNKRLAGWRGKILSQGGRLILIRHVLFLIPTHSFAAVAPPKVTISQLESIFSRFFWGADDSGPRHSWASWERLCRPVCENGLAVRRLGDVLWSFSCKIWCKWCLGLGIWARYIQSISWSKSVFSRHLSSVDSFMRTHIKSLFETGLPHFCLTIGLVVGLLLIGCGYPAGFEGSGLIY